MAESKRLTMVKQFHFLTDRLETFTIQSGVFNLVILPILASIHLVLIKKRGPLLVGGSHGG
jgi:hypothetical protein